MSDDTDLTLSRGFDAGNYSAAYDGLSLEAGLEKAVFESKADWHSNVDASSEAYRVAFTLGYCSSLELRELGDDEDAYLEALHSEHGQRCVALGYVDPA